MAELRETLEALHRCDREGEELAREQVQIPDAIGAAEARAQAAHDAVEAQRQGLEAAERRRREKEAELEDCEARREKYQGQTAMVRTNAEYTALLAEIDGMSQRISEVEEEILVAMESIDQLTSSLEVSEGEQRQAEHACLREVEALRARLAHVERGIEAHEELRGKLLGQLPPEAQTQYERATRTLGSGTALIQGRACGTCHRDVPYETINRVLASELRACPHCFRILVARDE